MQAPNQDLKTMGSMNGTPTRACAGVGSAKVKHERDFYLLLEPNIGARDSFSQPCLENIEEDYPMLMPPVVAFPAPETPLEPMEFLSRSWSISSVDVARALAPISQPAGDSHLKAIEAGPVHRASLEEPTLETAPFAFASSLTSQFVLDRIMAPGAEPSPLISRRNSHSSGPLVSMSPPLSPHQMDDDYKIFCSTWWSAVPMRDTQFRRSFSLIRPPLRGRSMGRWIKDLKGKRKEASRSQNAQVHAAATVAGVAAAIAAVTAATAASSQEETSTKTSIAVASAAALVAAQCVEVAESMGADKDHMAAIVSSAVNVRTAGDIMTLTAAAATALRGAATLKVRTIKEARSLAAVTPYERGCSYHSISSSGELMSEDNEAEHSCLSRGANFLTKLSIKGELHWRVVFVYLNKFGQVMVKLQSKHLGGTLKKNKKSLVLQVYPDIPAWPGRNLLEDSEKRRYFSLKTSTGDMEFECKNVSDHRLWTEGISRLIFMTNRQHQR